MILLMVQKSGEHQLKLVVYPIIYRVLHMLGGCLGFPSTVSQFFLLTVLLRRRLSDRDHTPNNLKGLKPSFFSILRMEPSLTGRFMSILNHFG